MRFLTSKNRCLHFCERRFLELCLWMKGYVSVICRPGGDLLFRVLGRSTIGAGAIYGRVRDGIGYGRPARATRPANDRWERLGMSG